jgi:5-methylcytosine-specific restriction endonuclease McrA
MDQEMKKWLVESTVLCTIDHILHLTKQNADLAQEAANTLASLNWEQVILKKQREHMKSLLRTMGHFIKWRVDGGGFCDECEETKYVGDYHHGPQYNKVYSWPHNVSPYTFDPIEVTSGKQYCIKHIHQMEEKVQIRFVRTASHPPFFLEMTSCKECGRLFPKRAAYKFGETFIYDNYCLHCVECAIEKQFVNCKGCNKRTASATNDYCYDCYQISLRIGTQVTIHLKRAREANTPATLTVKQWEQAITYFGGKCAYCQSRTFQALEHFIPINLGGGTTADNCVPACSRCNNKKGGAHPDNLNNFPPHVLTRVKNYLNSNKEEIKPCSIAGRELVIYQPTTSK